jgi:tRNA A37 threonylcarbamoyladenosine biosynthesis protein TsaE
MVELELFGSVLGRCLSSLDTLTAAYLPEGIDDASAAALVRRANELRPGTSPYAILVSAGKESDEDRDCIRVSAQNAIKYRQGDRLAVVVGKHPDLASFVQAFREVLGQNFPEGAGHEISLEAVAAAAVTEISEATEIDTTIGWDPKVASTRLAECLTLLAAVHKELRQGTESWNTYWFRHVGIGLARLVEKINTTKSMAPELSIDDVFERYTYAAFRLPRPVGAGVTKYSPKKFVEALQSYWADETTISATAKSLGQIAGDESGHHALQDVDWSGINSQMASDDNQAVALANYSPAGADVTEALSSLTDRDFVEPLGEDLTKARLKITDAIGRSLTASGASDSGSVAVAAAQPDEQGGGSLSEEVRVRIPVTGAPSPEELESTRLTFTTKAAKTDWYGSLERDDSGALWAVGNIRREGNNAPTRPIHFELKAPAGDIFSGRVNTSLSFDLLLAPSDTVGLLYLPLRAKGAAGKPKYVGADPNGGTFGVTLDGRASQYRYIVWTAGDGAAPLYEGAEMQPLNERPGLFAVDARPLSLANVVVGDKTFEIRAAESRVAPQSPIVAAVNRDRVAKDRPDLAVLQSIRGMYESLLAEGLLRNEWNTCMGHVVMPADRAFPLDDLDAQGGLLMTGAMAGTWANVTDFQVPDDVLYSAEAAEFRTAFKELDLLGAMQTRDADGATYVEWPSKTSWRHLWESRHLQLERYLAAYADLVEKARWHGDPAGVFWAAYPFSISVWATQPAAKCSTVLLSPLHPVRLAWLAGVESVLWESDWARDLAGTVEGWNFPLLGPKETSSGRLLAVPMETGDDQLFLGWSMLVRASIEGPEPLEAPDRIGDRPAPGSAASGLNATAVAAALRSYRQMNPHVSTLTVDLSASSESTRLHEVDDAVLKEVEAWTGRPDGPLIGGARIWDSNRRSGEPPREKMARLVRSNEGIPLTWSRYAPDSASMKRCNVRILQDAGVHVAVQSGQGRNLGVLGRAPLRRFESVAKNGTSKSSSASHPTFRPETGWEPLSRALRLIEGAASSPQVISKLFKANLVNDSADWTVSGEALMNPSAMAEIVQHSSGGSQMLWEWRPPFLDSSADVPLLERRPFVSVARVPGSFRAQIKKMLAKAQGGSVSDETLDDLLGQLGARGVGLSSLLSMGGTHASGALGFYLAFALMNRLDKESDNTYVLPIDACDSFLRALAHGKNHAEQMRRADLLLVRMNEEGVTLSPVEIKFYGLGSDDANGNLPGPSDAAMNEPLEQLRATQDLLLSVAESSRAIGASGSESDKALWSNGLAALVEAAIRLRPGGSAEPEALARQLEDLVNGKLEVRTGQPLVCYFKHEATTSEGENFRVVHTSDVEGASPGRGFGLLAANAGHAFEAVSDPKSALVREWNDLVQWALGNPIELPVPAPSEEAARGGNEPEPLQPQMPDVVTETIEAQPDHDEEGGSETGAFPAEETNDEPFPAPVAVPVPQEEGHNILPGDNSFVGGIRGDGVRFGVGRVLGTLGAATADYWPSNTELNQMNIGVVGDLGTGKTQLLKALVYQLREGSKSNQETPLSMLVFDYKRDFQSTDFLEAVGGRVLKPYRIPVNIFSLRDGYSPLAAYQRAQQFADVLDKIYGNIGPVQTDRLVTSIVNLYKEKHGEPPTLAEVLAEYSDGQKPDAVTSILKPFILGEIFSDDPKEMMSFEEMMEDKVVIVALNDFGTDDNGKNALVVMFLNLYYDYMLNATKWPFVGNAPQLRRLNSFLLVDEAVNIMKYNFPVLMNLMLQGREFGFGVILASQYLDHFKKDGRNYGQPLLTWFLHKVPSVTLKELQALGLPNITADIASKISSQKVHHALYSSLNFSGKFIEEMPFFKLLSDRADGTSNGS